MYREEYPRPQLRRENWMNLNGTWEFEIDRAGSGMARRLFEKDHLAGKIEVPFCPESSLSGIGDTDFMNCVWYRRDLDWEKKPGRRTILHFGAVDYKATLFVNGARVGEHRGGYVSFSFDITDALQNGRNSICLCAEDDVRSVAQPSGKQSMAYASAGCFYTRTTGIWQTVWLEEVSEVYLVRTRQYPNLDEPALDLELETSLLDPEVTVRAEAFYEGRAVGSAQGTLTGSPRLHLPLSEKHLWEVGCGRLYDLTITLSRGGEVLDRVESYFGLRQVAMRGRAFTINGKPVFGRFVLDQGFYPDGIYTAPSDEALRKDIEYGLELGFNGARLHEKIFEERYLYHADRMGYLVWGEFPNWGYDMQQSLAEGLIPEWLEEIARDFNHPSLIGWCPLNETWNMPFGAEINNPNGHAQDKELLRMVYRLTKAVDPTRPVIDTSGNFHCDETDIYDVHDYEQDPEKLRAYYGQIGEGIVRDQVERSPLHRPYQHYCPGQPVFLSEYGGIRWSEEAAGWGYGNAPKTEQEFLDRYQGLTDALLDNPYMMGFCYTQLYDVEQEQNGLMTYDRQYKFDPAFFRRVNERKAAIEE